MLLEGNRVFVSNAVNPRYGRLGVVIDIRYGPSGSYRGLIYKVRFLDGHIEDIKAPDLSESV